ncbi:MAG TPA: LytTR family DNA-binding domain-containing protein [Cyclobacteriaceae bacterium]|nr:LytTR family DNA-binding domain-containing protein [Cyclobacteriaceae bacterium]
MNVLIIEDELLAQQKLEAMLHRLDESVIVLAKLGSVKETLLWLSQNEKPDLAFVDIQLSDDHSFEIFKQFPIQFPVIFTTAFDKYLLESFEFNTIDYLLKPITEEKLKRSVEKVKWLEQHFLQENVLNFIQQEKKLPLLSRVIAKKGTDFVALDVDKIAYFYTEHKIVFVKDFQGRQLIVDTNLSDLEQKLDKKKFFRINRKYLSNLKAIEKFRPDNGKIRIYLTPEMREEIHVSKENAPQFRAWIS